MAQFAARVSQGHIGRAKYLATNENVRSNRAAIMRLPIQLNSLAAAFKAAQLLVDAAKADALADAERKDEDEISKLKEAWGATGSKMASGGSKAVKELEKEQKTRASRLVKDFLDGALLDLALESKNNNLTSMHLQDIQITRNRLQYNTSIDLNIFSFMCSWFLVK
jgi:DNA polymerase-3 subunit delta'